MDSILHKKIRIFLENFIQLFRLKKKTIMKTIYASCLNKSKSWYSILTLLFFVPKMKLEAKDLITDIKGLLDKDAFNSINLHEKLIYVLDYKYIKDVDKCANTAKNIYRCFRYIGNKKYCFIQYIISLKCF